MPKPKPHHTHLGQTETLDFYYATGDFHFYVNISSPLLFVSEPFVLSLMWRLKAEESVFFVDSLSSRLVNGDISCELILFPSLRFNQCETFLCISNFFSFGYLNRSCLVGTFFCW